MEIGSATEMGKNESGDQSFIQKQVSLTGGVEIKCGAGTGYGEGIDA